MTEMLIIKDLHDSVENVFQWYLLCLTLLFTQFIYLVKLINNHATTYSSIEKKVYLLLNAYNLLKKKKKTKYLNELILLYSLNTLKLKGLGYTRKIKFKGQIRYKYLINSQFITFYHSVFIASFIHSLIFFIFTHMQNPNDLSESLPVSHRSPNIQRGTDGVRVRWKFFFNHKLNT